MMWISTPLALDAIAVPPAADPPSLGRRVEARLRGGGYLALRGVVCDTRGDIVRLRGCLSTYYLKQVARTIAAEVEGVRLIINRIIAVGISTDEPPIGSDRARRGRRSPWEPEDKFGRERGRPSLNMHLERSRDHAGFEP